MIGIIASQNQAGKSFLYQADWYINAGNTSNTSQLAYDISGNGNDAQNGSGSGSDANDAVWLDKTITEPAYCYFPGNTSDYLSLTSKSLVGDVDLTFEVYKEDWDDGVNTEFCGQWAGTGNQRGFVLRQLSAGSLRLFVSLDGATASEVLTSNDISGISSGWHTIRFTRIQSTGVITFYVDGGQVGTATGAAGNLHNSTNDFRIGTGGAATIFSGRIRSLVFESGGVERVNVDIEADTSDGDTSFTATTGGTVTMNRSSSGLYTSIVHTAKWQFAGSSNYLTVPSYTPTFGDVTVVARVIMPDATPSSTSMILDARSSGDGFSLNIQTDGDSRFLVVEDANTPAADQSGLANDTWAVISGRRTDGSEVDVFVDESDTTETDTTSGDITCSGDVTIGAEPSGSSSIRGEISHAAIFYEALSDEDVSTIVGELS